jgi:hypothetical protein
MGRAVDTSLARRASTGSSGEWQLMGQGSVGSFDEMIRLISLQAGLTHTLRGREEVALMLRKASTRPAMAIVVVARQPDGAWNTKTRPGLIFVLVLVFCIAGAFAGAIAMISDARYVVWLVGGIASLAIYAYQFARERTRIFNLMPSHLNPGGSRR